MRCTKSIDELYEEVREFDLVITTDAALATALNARIDKPIVGYFALTPKQIAAHVAASVLDRPLCSELKVISAVSEYTGLRLKYVHSEIENIKEIRKYAMDVKKYLYSAASREIYDAYEPLPTLERLMGAFEPEKDDFYRGVRTAVIEEELFNDLDKHFIPIEHESVSIFKKDSYEIERMYEVGNDRQLAENAADLIANPYDTAIVFNTTSPISDAVRTALYRKNIPFINSLNVRDLSQIRDYLQFISLAMDFDTVRVKHVKELFSNYNGFFRKGRESFLLCKQTESDMSPRAYGLWEVMRDIRSMTYAEVCDAICDRRAKIQVDMLIKDLGIKDTKITSLNLDEVKYAVDNVKELRHSEEIPDSEKKGVLLVDCNNSVYIDRPVVIYLGMGQDWNKSVVGKQYIDVEDETDKNVMRLNALIQQGSVRFYLVNSTKGGKPARPSMLFDLLYKRPTDSFGLMCGELVKGRWHREVEETAPVDEDKKKRSEERFDQKFSKSSFNNYYSCPRMFMYGTFLTTPEEKATEFGNLIHAFAEFYLCYPGDVKEKGVQFFADMVSDRFSGLSSPLMEGLDNAKIRHAMGTVMEYIDSLNPGEVPLDEDVSAQKYPNMFMVELGKRLTSSYCEREIESTVYPVKGKMDLFIDGMIADYKTGRPSKAADIVKAMTVDSGYKYPEFQPAIYLAIAREQPGNRGEFYQFYAMDNDVSISEGQMSALSNARRVRISDAPLKETMVNSRGFRAYLGNEMNNLLKDHADEIMDIIGEYGSDDPSVWRGQEDIVSRVIECTGKKDGKTVRKDVVSGLSKVVNANVSGMLTYYDTVEIPIQQLDAVMEFVAESHKRMVEQSATEFPSDPRIECRNCRYFQVCTRDMIDAGGEQGE